jgi:hypothetical protein
LKLHACIFRSTQTLLRDENDGHTIAAIYLPKIFLCDGPQNEFGALVVSKRGRIGLLLAHSPIVQPRQEKRVTAAMLDKHYHGSL